MLSVLPPSRPSIGSKLRSITVRGFSGGLNSVDSDISMDSRSSVVLNNLRRVSGGSQQVRYGNGWFADVKSVVTGNIIDMEYFADVIIAVTSTGQIASIDANGMPAARWNTAIAGALTGHPGGWSNNVVSVDFVPFRGQLIIHNGVDKPVTISKLLIGSYLADLATGSNVNVPIGQFGCVVSNYHCVAGIPTAPTTIYVSALGTAGTFPGDPAPNDAIAIDVGAYAPDGATEIRGIAGYRTNLIVFFGNQSLIVELGNYDDDGHHKPRFPDVLPTVGLLSHRAIVKVGNDIRFASLGSFNSARRNLFGNVDSDTLSDIVEPEFKRTFGTLANVDQQNKCFAVYDSILHDTIVYSPSGKALVYSDNDKLKYKSWSTYSGPTWTAGCASFLGRVFLSYGSRIYKSGNNVFPNEVYRADKINDRDNNWFADHQYAIGDIAWDPAESKSYRCITSHVSGSVSFAIDRANQSQQPFWEVYEGEAITFTMELPWLDGQDPTRVKMNQFLSMATKGDAEFTVRVWVDNIYQTHDGSTQFTPALEVKLIGNDAIGFGYDAGPYGGGRRSNDPRLYRFPVKFKSMKMIVTGSVRKYIEFAAISFLYSIGRFQR